MGVRRSSIGIHTSAFLALCGKHITMKFLKALNPFGTLLESLDRHNA